MFLCHLTVLFIVIKFFFFLLQVNSIYKDPSIGNFINIAVVKINVYKSEEVSINI